MRAQNQDNVYPGIVLLSRTWLMAAAPLNMLLILYTLAIFHEVIVLKPFEEMRRKYA
jgi:hypothetical protein